MTLRDFFRLRQAPSIGQRNPRNRAALEAAGMGDTSTAPPPAPPSMQEQEGERGGLRGFRRRREER